MDFGNPWDWVALLASAIAAGTIMHCALDAMVGRAARRRRRNGKD